MEFKKHPPTTFDEWLTANNYTDWPLHVEEEDDDTELLQTPQYLEMATMDDIYQKVASKARIFSIKKLTLKVRCIIILVFFILCLALYTGIKGINSSLKLLKFVDFIKIGAELILANMKGSFLNYFFISRCDFLSL